MCSVERNQILVKTYLVGGTSERNVPGRTLTEVRVGEEIFHRLRAVSLFLVDSCVSRACGCSQTKSFINTCFFVIVATLFFQFLFILSCFSFLPSFPFLFSQQIFVYTLTINKTFFPSFNGSLYSSFHCL